VSVRTTSILSRPIPLWAFKVPFVAGLKATSALWFLLQPLEVLDWADSHRHADKLPGRTLHTTCVEGRHQVWQERMRHHHYCNDDVIMHSWVWIAV